MNRTLILLFVCLISGFVFGQTKELEDSISSLINKYEAIGVSVAVVKDNKIVYTHAFGYKDFENSIPLHTDDLFRIASVSKTLTATAIMQLAEKRKLSLDDDINRYLGFKVHNPKFPETAITIKMLMCHRSSINDSQGYKSFEKVVSATNSLSSNCYGEYEPGSKYVYCNLNYNILGAIIENVSGKRFDKYIRQNILKPLKLHGSFNVLDLDTSRFVKAYWFNKQKNTFSLSRDTYLSHKDKMDYYKLGFTTPYLSPAGGLKISVVELAQYMLMHMNDGVFNKKRIIRSESEKLMRQLPDKKHWYALSITHYNFIISGEKLLGQTGGAHGIHTAMIFHPEKKYGFVVFCNGCKSKSMDGHELNFEIIKCLYKSLIVSNQVINPVNLLGVNF